MKVDELEEGALYRVKVIDKLGVKMGATPLEEASRLSLYMLTNNQIRNRKHYNYRLAEEMQEPLVYLGRKRVYGGMNGNTTKFENVHHFVRPNGSRVYIYGHHIKYITPFT